ncbi:MAG: hypothetical protein A3H01_00710 [Candidatus Wildermuthbacteria bacterium RIFCSPLOWO2_12_FULL_40_9]|uniref:Uncharacterized protein n=2 Tax=Candidatus Wildermuthiibacteriota TaxID=1817923 RepID=A0A1G2REP7_9BACT|nr:MAG: hypothetical protein A3F15_00945 [Candidatus Wildermuthbacteria bacterium RIFCSPHIGHO2_12_FULL_40_12]OHA76330.1 MAG: hypothetical protein A3H01_00710 [Candidatus Wildermuthbacteria bacterium RIFCSPLOWO2_12_FULL_40_9]
MSPKLKFVRISVVHSANQKLEIVIGATEPRVGGASSPPAATKWVRTVLRIQSKVFYLFKGEVFGGGKWALTRL